MAYARLTIMSNMRYRIILRGSRADLVNSDEEEEEGGSSTPSADHSDKIGHSLNCIRYKIGQYLNNISQDRTHFQLYMA